jgi:hypothetical protein
MNALLTGGTVAKSNNGATMLFHPTREHSEPKPDILRAEAHFMRIKQRHNQ